MTKKTADTGTELEAQEDVNESENPYEVLGVPKTATDNMIKTAFRKLASRWHPDKHKEMDPANMRAFQRAREAYEFLLNPIKRREYDATGKMPDSDEEVQIAAKAAVIMYMGRVCEDYAEGILEDTDDLILRACGTAVRFGEEKKLELKKAKKRHKSFARLIKRFAKKTPEFERTLVHDMLLKKLDEELQQIVEAEQEIEVLKVALPMLQSYKYALPQRGVDEDAEEHAQLGYKA